MKKLGIHDIGIVLVIIAMFMPWKETQSVITGGRVVRHEYYNGLELVQKGEGTVLALLLFALGSYAIVRFSPRDKQLAIVIAGLGLITQLCSVLTPPGSDSIILSAEFGWKMVTTTTVEAGATFALLAIVLLLIGMFRVPEPEKPDSKYSELVQKCPQCGASNRKAARRCMVCGATFYADEQALHRAAVKALKPFFDELFTLEAFAQTMSGHDEIVRQRVAEFLGERDDERVLEPLFHLLKDEAEKVRAAAAKSLGQLSYAQAMVPLLQTLDDPAVVVRRTAIDALQQWSDQRMVNPLAHALTDEDATVRLKAAQLLGKLKDEHAIEPLFKLLEDANTDVRQAAVASLVQLGGGGLRPLTQALFNLISGDVESRVQAAVVLGELGDARAVGVLQGALKSEKEDHVRTAVMQSLRTLGVDPIPVLIQQLEGQRSDNAAEALIQMGKDAVESLLQALESTESSTARWQILQMLGKIGDTQAVPAIIKALGSHGYAAAKAAEALGVLDDPRATLPLVKLLGETSLHPTREAVIQALIQLSDEQAIEPLAGLLESPRRGYAIQVLQGMGEAGMQALIQTYENTKDRATRKVIGEALGDRKPKRGLFGGQKYFGMTTVQIGILIALGLSCVLSGAIYGLWSFSSNWLAAEATAVARETVPSPTDTPLPTPAPHTAVPTPVVASDEIQAALDKAVTTETWVPAGSLAVGRHLHTATLLSDGRVLIVGGIQGRTRGSQALTSVEIYDPVSGTWSTTDSLSDGRTGHTATRLPDGRVLVAGGRATLFDITLSSVEVYDPAIGTWSPASSLSVPRHNYAATLLRDGRVLAVGGYDYSSGHDHASAEIFDPIDGTWSTTGSLATPRNNHSATRLADGRVLVVGGYNKGYLTSAEIYDPVRETWNEVASPLFCHGVAHTATLLPDGRVLITGGSCGTLRADAEIYDPATGTWSSTATLPAVRYFHTSTLLPGGKVLVVGGSDGSANYDSAWVYDPVSGRWSLTGSLATGHAAHTATLLASGQVLVAAGWEDTYLDSAEMYVPKFDPEAMYEGKK